MMKALYRALIELSNNRYISAGLRRFSRSRFSKVLIPSYIRIFHIRTDEIKKDLSEFESLHDLFTRQIKEDARMICNEENVVVSPVDSVLESFGDITEESTFIVKGQGYSILDMLEKKSRAERYIGGKYMVLYLSPSHYHRIHSPMDGMVTERFTLGRKSYPVNQMGLTYGKEPLSKNYRAVTEVTSNDKHVAIVKVGAMWVNSIELLHEREQVHRGEEIAYFSFGSTIVLLFEKDTFAFDPALTCKQDVVVGMKLGTFI
ncbi:MAG: phosphatidylserine decarboxylase [Bacillaceae bacterium]